MDIYQFDVVVKDITSNIKLTNFCLNAVSYCRLKKRIFALVDRQLKLIVARESAKVDGKNF